MRGELEEHNNEILGRTEEDARMVADIVGGASGCPNPHHRCVILAGAHWPLSAQVSRFLQRACAPTRRSRYFDTRRCVCSPTLYAYVEAYVVAGHVATWSRPPGLSRGRLPVRRRRPPLLRCAPLVSGARW